MSEINMQDLIGFQIGYGAFLYGRPPSSGNMEMDVAVIINDGDNFEEIRQWLEESASLFERSHEIHVDGLLMTESNWLERQRRIFGVHPHEPHFATVETWDGVAYVPIYNERYITEKIGFCREHPIDEGLKEISPEMRFGTAVERR